MNPKRKQRRKGETQSAEAPVDQSITFLKLFLAASVQAKQSGNKMDLDKDLQWEVWRICRRIANQPEDRLAGLLAAPALAVVRIIEELIWKTEAGLSTESFDKEQRGQLATLSEQLDLALAMIMRKLRHLAWWRAVHTTSPDLLLDTLHQELGDPDRAVALIRRYFELHPSDAKKAERENLFDAFAWDTYKRVEILDRLADEFPNHIRTAAEEMRGWPMLRHRYHDNLARFEELASRLNLGAEYPLETSKKARFRANTPMVCYLDSLVCRLYYVRQMTQDDQDSSVEAGNDVLRSYGWSSPDDPRSEEVLARLRTIRTLPPLTKSTAAEWTKRGIVPLILVTDAFDFLNCKEPALKAIANQNGVKSVATFKSRLLVVVIPTLTSMARPG